MTATSIGISNKPNVVLKFVRELGLVASLLFLYACASTPRYHVALSGDIMVDGPNMIANGPPRDKVLWQYRMAATAMRQGKYDQARQILDDALVTLQGI